MIYSDPLGQNQIAQPIITDNFGHADFYVATGTYTVVVVNNGKVQNVYPDQSIGGTGESTFSLNGLTGAVSIQAGAGIGVSVIGSSVIIARVIGANDYASVPNLNLGDGESSITFNTSAETVTLQTVKGIKVGSPTGVGVALSLTGDSAGAGSGIGSDILDIYRSGGTSPYAGFATSTLVGGKGNYPVPCGGIQLGFTNPNNISMYYVDSTQFELVDNSNSESFGAYTTRSGSGPFWQVIGLPMNLDFTNVSWAAPNSYLNMQGGTGSADFIQLITHSSDTIILRMDAYGSIIIDQSSLSAVPNPCLTLKPDGLGPAHNDVLWCYDLNGNPSLKVLSNGNVSIFQGLEDSTGSIGTSGQLLSSNGTGVVWTTFTLQSLSPTSELTAGITGQIVFDSTNFYICTSGGSAGYATWKKVALSSD
jgi:hypothetical protein